MIPASGRMPRCRADVLLVRRGVFESRARAQAAIAAGLVVADGVVVGKPSDMLDPGAEITAEAPHPWVSRGGVKLAAALDAFGFDPAGIVCLDLGASTGGFTDVLLRRGAARVYAVDVGRDQLHDRLREDPRVVSCEGLDARALTSAHVPEPVGLVVADLSFISATLVLPNALARVGPDAGLVLLVKPQFDAGRAAVAKGVVRDPSIHREVCERLSAFVSGLGWTIVGLLPSPLLGGDGNREFLLGARRGAAAHG